MQQALKKEQLIFQVLRQGPRHQMCWSRGLVQLVLKVVYLKFRIMRQGPRHQMCWWGGLVQLVLVAWGDEGETFQDVNCWHMIMFPGHKPSYLFRHLALWDVCYKLVNVGNIARIAKLPYGQPVSLNSQSVWIVGFDWFWLVLVIFGWFLVLVGRDWCCWSWLVLVDLSLVSFGWFWSVSLGR